MTDRIIRYDFTCEKKKEIDATLDFLENINNSDGFSIKDHSFNLVDSNNSSAKHPF
jgi:hypothetical protein